jgi:hypothetical protein
MNIYVAGNCKVFESDEDDRVREKAAEGLGTARRDGEGELGTC